MVSWLLPLLGLIRASSADIVYFDPTGQGKTTVAFASLDWDLGNSLAIGALPASQNGRDFVEYYQARLASFQDNNSKPIPNVGLNADYELTIVAGYTLTGSRLYNNGAITIDSNELATAQPVNFFTIYLDHNRNSNDLAGTGFADGIAIIQGTIKSGVGNFLTYATTSQLDQFSRTANAWNVTNTAGGTGSVDLQLTVTEVNSAYVNAPGSLSAAQLGGEQALPYRETVPGLLISNHTPDIGINGLSGPDMLLQTDSNMAFTVSLPQPTAFGAGLAAMLALAALRTIRRACLGDSSLARDTKES